MKNNSPSKSNSILNIKESSIIYILCASNHDTGGPKDLHQLGSELKKLKKKFFMFYYPGNSKDPVHKNFKIYNLPITKTIDDCKSNILIVPEIDQAIKFSRKYKKIQKILYWQSLDNFFITHFYFNVPKFIKSIIKKPFKIINFFNDVTKNYFGNLSFPKYLKIIYLNFPFNNFLLKKDFKINLSQSYYQYTILKSKKIQSFMLADYIRDEYFDYRKKIILEKKKNIICYNPAKSSKFMLRIIQDNPHVRFIPLMNYSMFEVIKILSKSKIYMDFGYHPGVDHLPREAAILKNCIITNKEGSAYYEKAVPIDFKYKFDEKKENLSRIKSLINEIFFNFNLELRNFDGYVDRLKKEKTQFQKQVSSIFD